MHDSCVRSSLALALLLGSDEVSKEAFLISYPSSRQLPPAPIYGLYLDQPSQLEPERGSLDWSGAFFSHTP